MTRRTAGFFLLFPISGSMGRSVSGRGSGSAALFSITAVIFLFFVLIFLVASVFPRFELEDHTNGSGKTYSIGGLTDVFVDLQTGHEYKVQAIAIAVPPEGYLLTAPLYAGAELTAK